MKILDCIEMMDEDVAENINLYDFDIAPYRSAGWRLPSAAEVRVMLGLHRRGEGRFQSDWYMTGETGNDFDNLGIHFADGREELRRVDESHWGCCRVRLVRDVGA